MPKTRAQKSKIIEKWTGEIKEAKNLIFVDFGGTKTQDLRELRLSLKEAQSKFQVIKKRLLRIVLKEKGVDFDPKSFEAQVGTVFVNDDISDAAGRVYRFSKDKENFKILGGFDLNKGEKLEADFLKRIGQLPGREVLLGQVLGTMVAPLRAFMWILSQKGLPHGRQVEEVK